MVEFCSGYSRWPTRIQSEEVLTRVPRSCRTNASDTMTPNGEPNTGRECSKCGVTYLAKDPYRFARAVCGKKLTPRKVLSGPAYLLGRQM
jgi:hypothetical protein